MKNAHVNLRWTSAAVAAMALLGAGAGAMYLALGMRDAATAAHEHSATLSPGAAGAAAPGSPAATSSDATVTLPPDAIERAGITVAAVDVADASDALRLPGVVTPHGYRQVQVTPLVAGRITRVLVQLGDAVRQGQAMAEVFSPELAEAHTRYTAARAELGAHERELQRTERLVEIGAASRQELERVHAAHEARTADVGSARSRLELLGVPAATLDGLSGGEVVATATVPAPIAGVVTERTANVGLNVDPAAALFTVVDLSTVWIVADLYERDFSRVRVGSPAAVTTTAYPDRVLNGRVTYIDPQVSAETRTAKLRVEIPNPRHELRLGMYADVLISSGSAPAVPVIPRTAVQNVGDRQVVYVADPSAAGMFREREVRLGPSAGDRVEVLSGLQPGDRIVVEGSFFIRAEREQ